MGHSERRRAGIKEDHHTVAHESRCRTADQRFWPGILLPPLDKGRFRRLEQGGATMDKIKLAAIGKKLQVAPDGLAGNIEEVRKLGNPDGTIGCKTPEDLAVTAGSKSASVLLF
jgi:hypothetical protein